MSRHRHRRFEVPLVLVTAGIALFSAVVWVATSAGPVSVGSPPGSAAAAARMGVPPPSPLVSLGWGEGAGIAPAPEGSPPAVHPGSIGASGGWDGLNESASCKGGCFPADPDIAAGNGYVVEVANAAYRVWSSTGSLLHNTSLATLFNSGNDRLSGPRVQFDPTGLRWTLAVVDVSRSVVLYGATTSSDPTGLWHLQRWTLPGGDAPSTIHLATNSFNLVLTTDVYHEGSFAGSQVFVANKTQLYGTGGVSTWTSPLRSGNQSLIPAVSSQASTATYLVSDGIGLADLGVATLSGSPPGSVSIATPIDFPGGLVAPPAASQAGSSSLVETLDARVQSAASGGGMLWAVAGAGCTPLGDLLSRSCLHLWEISMRTGTLNQSFNWSTGAGTYDFLPALSLDPRGDLAVAFEESSSISYPGVFATGQSAVDGAGTLESPVLLAAGTGPDNRTGECSFSVCPFGNYSGAAFGNSAGGIFWVAGEYPSDPASVNAWNTWVGRVTISPTYPVIFRQGTLPPGTPWSVSVNGVQATSTNSSIQFDEASGAYTFGVQSPLAGGPQTRFIATNGSGTFSVTTGPLVTEIGFVEQYSFSAAALPAGAGFVSPSSGWMNASAQVTLAAFPADGYEFHRWVGDGPGAYSGGANPALVAITGPVSELAIFAIPQTFALTFTESGLPAGAVWTVDLNGAVSTTNASSVAFPLSNGTYVYQVNTPAPLDPHVRYVASRLSGVVVIAGSDANQSIAYQTQVQLLTSASPAGKGFVNPPTNWYALGGNVTLTAVPSPGFQFVRWVGGGIGNYSGNSNPVTIVVTAPLQEVAKFAATPAPSPGTAPLPSSGGGGATTSILFGVLVAALAAAIVVAVWRRRKPPVQPPAPTASSAPPAGSGTIDGVDTWSE